MMNLVQQLLAYLQVSLNTSKKYEYFVQVNPSLLVGEITGGGFGTHRGDKTHSFISKQQAYKIQAKHS